MGCPWQFILFLLYMQDSSEKKNWVLYQSYAIKLLISNYLKKVLYQSYAIKLLNYSTVLGFSEGFLISFLKLFLFPHLFRNLNLSVMFFANEKTLTLKYNWNSTSYKSYTIEFLHPCLASVI